MKNFSRSVNKSKSFCWITFIFFVCAISSCNNKRTITDYNKLLEYPEINSQFVFEVNTSSTYTFNVSQLYEKDNNYYFFGFDFIQNKLDLYDINKKIRLKTSILKRNDSIKINKIDMFYVSSFDTIFLFRRYPSTIIITDSAFNKFKFVKFPYEIEINNKKTLSLIDLDLLSKSIFYEKTTDWLFFPIFNHEAKTFKMKWELPIIAEYSLLNNKVINVGFPIIRSNQN